MAKIPTKTKVAAKAAIINTPTPVVIPAKKPAKRLTSAKPPAPVPSLPVKPANKAPAPKKKPVVAAVIEAQPAAPIANRSAPPRRKPAAVAANVPQEAVALRAYYIGENRRAKGLSGDSHQDWIEAERQIQSETRSKLKTGKH